MTSEHNIGLLRDQLGKCARGVRFEESTAVLTTPAAARERFTDFAETATGAGAPWLRVLAEPVWTGRTADEVALWTRFESMINVLLASAPMTIVCPYDLRAVTAEVGRQAHVTHPLILSGAGTAESAEYDVNYPIGP